MTNERDLELTHSDGPAVKRLSDHGTTLVGSGHGVRLSSHGVAKH